MNRRNFLKAALASSGMLVMSPAFSTDKHPHIARLTIYPGDGLAEAPMSDLLAAYKPLARELSGRMGRTAGLTIVRDAVHTDRRPFSSADYLLVPPTTAAILIQQGGFVPLARSVVSAKGSLVSGNAKIKSVGQAYGSKFAFAQQGTWLERMSALALAKNSIRPQKVDYFEAQDAISECLLSGQADVGCLTESKVGSFVAKGGRVIAKLDETPDFTFLVSTKVGRAERDRAREVVIGLQENTIASLQKGIHAPVPRFVEASAREYKTIIDALKA